MDNSKDSDDYLKGNGHCILELKVLASSRWSLNFRDNILGKTPEGKEIIRLYYKWSPVIVRAIKDDKEFKGELKALIDEILPMIRTGVE